MSDLDGPCLDIGQGQPMAEVGGKLRRAPKTQPLQYQSDATWGSDRSTGAGQKLEADPVLGREGAWYRPRLRMKDRHVKRNDRAGAWIVHASHLKRPERNRRPSRDEQLFALMGRRRGDGKLNRSEWPGLLRR